MPVPPRSLRDRALSRYIPDSVTGCWIWQGRPSHYGYGQIFEKRDGVWYSRKAHRVVYEFLVGPIPEGLDLDHLCRNPICVNPAHLEAVPHRVNMERGSWAMKTHCPQGHPYDERNTYVDRRGGKRMRHCKTCDRDRKRVKRGSTDVVGHLTPNR